MKNYQDPNVTLRDEKEKKYFPCPVCDELKEIETDKKGKPYLTCNDCGVQLFVRGKEGIRKISKQLPVYTKIGISKEKLAVLHHFNELQKKLIDIRDEKPLFGSDESLNIQEKTILKQIELIKKYLEL